MRTSDFDYELPPALIAQHPAATRDASRLLMLDRASGLTRHLTFRELPSLIQDGDLLVVNDTRVIPARLLGTLRRASSFAAGAGHSGAATPPSSDREVEIFLLREEPAVRPERIWTTLARPARSLQVGALVHFTDPAYSAHVVGTGERGVRHVAFRPVGAAAHVAPEPAVPFESWLSRVGHIPLPPYIDRPDEPEDRERYQTIFARDPGSVAAPTAGLHFTEEVTTELRARGAMMAGVTLHVGPGTFRPVATENPAEHVLASEPYRVPTETVAAIRQVRERRSSGGAGRIVAVGTTAVRTLESWALAGEPDDGAWRETGLFILPPFEFRVIDGMITNFHLPRSSLLMLVSALAGREHILTAYREAVAQRYRFYSYGDAMLIL